MHSFRNWIVQFHIYYRRGSPLRDSPWIRDSPVDSPLLPGAGPPATVDSPLPGCLPSGFAPACTSPAGSPWRRGRPLPQVPHSERWTSPTSGHSRAGGRRRRSPSSPVSVPCAALLTTAAMLAAVPRPPLENPEADPATAAVFEKAAAARRAAPSYERNVMTQFFTGQGASSGMSSLQRCILTEQRCTLTAIRSCVEWEPESLPLLATLLGKPVLPLGLLPPSPDGGRRAIGSNGADHATVRWLDAQPPGSVVYVALGSEVPLREEQVRELALGLELAGTRFLWALRKQIGADDDPLPPGFEDRTTDRGLVATGWVPQMSILAHAAVGGFLTHCGRNSLIESLLFGHPLVMLPIFGDQGPNARQMEAKKVGLQVARDQDDGSFDRHGVASAVRAVMVEGEDRRRFVEGAAKMQAVVADKELQDRYIDEFVQQLRSYSTDDKELQVQTDGSFSTAAAPISISNSN